MHEMEQKGKHHVGFKQFGASETYHFDSYKYNRNTVEGKKSHLIQKMQTD